LNSSIAANGIKKYDPIVTPARSQDKRAGRSSSGRVAEPQPKIVLALVVVLVLE